MKKLYENEDIRKEVWSDLALYVSRLLSELMMGGEERGEGGRRR